jgi:hypothetical protein
MTDNTNPLSGFYRTPKLYVKIPSKGKFYKKGVIDWPATGELAVLGMSARDEVLTRNPDALLNGDAVLKLIKSCVPEVNKPEELIAPDVEVLLIAIRAASAKDAELDIDCVCPQCENEDKFSVNLELAVQEQDEVILKEDVEISNGLLLNITPANYLFTLQSTKEILEQAQVLQELVRTGAAQDSKERMKGIGEAYSKLAEFNYSVILNSIRNIRIPDSDTVIDDKDQIAEFLNNVDTAIGKEIDAIVATINNGGIKKNYDAVCSECEHEYEVPINYDPVGFFMTS